MNEEKKYDRILHLIKRIIPLLKDVVSEETLERATSYLGYIDAEELVDDIVRHRHALKHTHSKGNIKNMPSVRAIGLQQGGIKEIGSSIIITDSVVFTDGQLYSYNKQGDIETINAGCQPTDKQFYIGKQAITIPDGGYQVRFDKIGNIDLSVVQTYSRSIHEAKLYNGKIDEKGIAAGTCVDRVSYQVYNTSFLGFGDTYHEAISKAMQYGGYRTTDEITGEFDCIENKNMQYCWYLYPKRLGKVLIVGNDSKTSYEFQLVNTIAYTNSNRYMEDYYIYRTNRPVLDKKFSIIVKN